VLEKSLCFQFSCVAPKTLTVVLMPTISLIKDQYQHLEVTGLRTTFLGTLQTDKSILSRIAQMEFDLVLCTPESFYDSVGTPKPVFKSLALQRRIGDEAHLVTALFYRSTATLYPPQPCLQYHCMWDHS